MIHFPKPYILEIGHQTEIGEGFTDRLVVLGYKAGEGFVDYLLPDGQIVSINGGAGMASSPYRSFYHVMHVALLPL